MKNMAIIRCNRCVNYFAMVAGILLMLGSVSVAADSLETGDNSQESEAQVIKKFTDQGSKESKIITIGDQRKRQIMFAMGVPLLLFIVITVGLGISMGVFGKDVYIAHMIFAGLSLTLALGHAIVGLVWFWPF